LVSQKEAFIDHFVRQADGLWTVTTVVGMAANLTIASIDCTLQLSEIYDKIQFRSEQLDVRQLSTTGF
jgi:hypothetical protein